MHTRVGHLPRVMIAAALLIGAACGGDSTSPQDNVASKVEAVSAATQSATVGSAMSAPLVVRVSSAHGRPIVGANVSFRVTVGAGSVTPPTMITDASGQARATFTLSVVAGANEVTASVSGVTTPQRFAITGTASTLARVVNASRNARLYGGVGDTIRLRAGGEDQFGNSVETAVQWTSRNAAAISVDGNGLVRALQRDVAGYVIAAAGAPSDSTFVQVLESPCAEGPTPVALALGQVVTGASLTSLCITGAAGAEYAAVVFNPSAVAFGSSSFELVGIALGAPPAAGPASIEQSISTSLVAGASTNLQPDETFERTFRERERVQLAPFVTGARDWYQSRAAPGALRNSIPSTVRVGDIVQINVEGTSGCTTSAARVRGARVAAVSNLAVIVSDTANPAGGFTDAESQSIAAQFDTLVTPVDTAAFGQPTDIDGNGKVVIVYTRTVNELTPRGANSYVGGLTTSRDLFPTSTSAGFIGCAASNVGEMFYMLAPDSTGAVNGNVRSKSFVLSVTVGTIAHEFQHLINAARRLYVLRQGGASWQEEVWLNEGLSHIAEELVYYRSSRNTSRSNLTPTTIRGSQVQVDAFNSFQLPNYGRYRSFVSASSATSPYANNDELATRGAIWSFLRYAADRLGSTDGTLWYRLVNSGSSGLSNLQTVFGVDQAGLTGLLRDWATSVYADDLVSGLPTAYSQPSWNWRSLYQGLFAQPQAFPLVATSLADATAWSSSLMGGAATVGRFTIGSGVNALLRLTAPGGGTLAGPVTLSVIRVK